MASAVKIATPTPPEAEPRGWISPSGWAYRAIDSIYRFLASLKLAVITLGSLATVLAYATFFESSHGAAAVQEWIYQSRWFAVLLAFLGANILCAALIRYPWKKRQTGFVVTHAGLLIVLGGSWYGLMNSNEGEVVAAEGEVKNELIKTDAPMIRVEELNPQNPGTVDRSWELPYRPGTFGWGPGVPRPRSIFQELNPLNLLDKEDRRKPREVLTRPDDPFQLVVKSHIPASIPATVHEPGPDGSPMAKIEPHFKAPRMPKAQNIFEYEGDRWFVASDPAFRLTRNRSPSTGETLPARFTFAYVDRPQFVEDFLNPPKVESDMGTARFRYRDTAGETHIYDWVLSEQTGKPVVLPGSDLTVAYAGNKEIPAARFRMQGAFEEPMIPFATFEVSRGNEPPAKCIAIAMMPMFPNLGPDRSAEGKDPIHREPLVSINYYLPPVVDEKINGLRGAVEVLGAPEGRLYYRVFGRSKDGKSIGELRENRGPIEKGKEVTAFGGNPGMPMTISFVVSEYLTSGVAKNVCEPIVLPKSQMGNGLAASLVAMTVNENGKDVTKEFYLRRSRTFEPEWETVEFPSGVYRIAFDTERDPLGFDVKLEDFEATFDPGTDQASSYMSKVLVTDKARGVEDKPVTIRMNEPMNHGGYTFYQSSYIPEEDPRTHRKTGRFQSVFHVRHDPSWTIKYFGCLLVVLGAFLQFYMRAGLFTDGGKREQAKAERKSAAEGKATEGSTTVVEAPPKRPRRSDAEDIL